MNNYCKDCGTENEPEYKYCKNCGGKLYDENEEANTESSSNATYVSPEKIIVDTIDGVPSEEMSIFIGKKASDIMPKFSKMAITNSKISWCWPAALLGIFLGPIGSALWFFYRKMYKPAFLLSVIGAVVTIATTLMTGGINIDFTAVMEALVDGDVEAYTTALQSISPKDTMLSAISSIIENGANIVSCILCGLFGFYFYKKHCVEKIISYREMGTDKRFYKMGLASIGGVSGGMVVLGIVIMIMVTNFATIIATLIGI